VQDFDVLLEFTEPAAAVLSTDSMPNTWALSTMFGPLEWMRQPPERAL
jgi:hypothetical protein